MENLVADSFPLLRTAANLARLKLAAAWFDAMVADLPPDWSVRTASGLGLA